MRSSKGKSVWGFGATGSSKGRVPMACGTLEVEHGQAAVEGGLRLGEHGAGLLVTGEVRMTGQGSCGGHCA
jgi:hypothetical protein